MAYQKKVGELYFLVCSILLQSSILHAEQAKSLDIDSFAYKKY